MESDGMPMDREAAAAQLAALQSSRAQMADRAMQPWWYDALFGLLLGGFIASYSLHSTGVTVVAMLLLVLGLRGLMTLYQRLTGFWVNGLRAGWTQRAVWVWLLTCCLVLGVGFAADYELEWPGAMVVTGAVLGTALAFVSRWWTRIYIAELRATP